ncbi:unnamed protein product [Miscanthus lutarioriparius]|uniref:PRA1 family protein n=1 Tax=Miscanthus lutarioriparius TaxID=422564 RepID=A0A811RZT7_9POAL|nr:unnamed protein product [Miscanthus lutarioriparius]
MSKYGTISASSSSAPTPKGIGSTALDVTCRANVPGSCALLASRCRPWRELADPSALSVPGGFTDAYHRARANLAHFADNYKLVFLVVLSVSLLLWPPFRMPIVLPCFFTMRSKVFPVHLALTLLLLVLIGATASVTVALPVGLLLVLVHAVLRLPADSVDEEAGRGSAAELPSTNC